LFTANDGRLYCGCKQGAKTDNHTNNFPEIKGSDKLIWPKSVSGHFY
jgi:hypothetical protein